MPDLLTNLGLRANNAFAAQQIPNYAPHFLIGNFLMTYIFASSRFMKMRAGIDYNIAPRSDGHLADAAVKEGKITQAHLDKINRLKAAHENGIEHFPMFVGALAMAVSAGVANETVNKYALLYTLVRAAYTIVYVNNTTRQAAGVRSVLFWAGNILCIRLLWFSGKAFNALKF